MKSSFMADLEKKETTAKQKDPSTETVAETATETATAEVAEEAEQVEASQDTEELPANEISDETLKQLSDKGSFLDRIKEAELKAKKEAEEEEAALAQAELEEQEAELKEEEQEEDVKEPVFELELDGKKFDSIDAVKAHMNEWNEEKTSLQKEVEEIRSFVEKVSDPELIEVLRYVADGYSYRVAMIKAGMDESIFSIDADDEDAEALVTAKIERKQAAENQKKEQAKLQKNMEQSNKELEAFQSQEGFDEKTKGDLIGLMTRVHSELLNGLVTKETLGIFAKAINYEKVVEESKEAIKQAKEAGEIAGRNQKIVIERQRKQGDNIPSLGRGVSQEQPRRESKLKSLVSIPSGSFMDKIRKN